MPTEVVPRSPLSILFTFFFFFFTSGLIFIPFVFLVVFKRSAEETRARDNEKQRIERGRKENKKNDYEMTPNNSIVP